MDIAATSLLLSNRQRAPVFIHGTAQCQYFEFPKYVMYYVLKNPKSPKQWKKAVQTCKWFFDENPIIVIPCLHFDRNYTFDGYATCSTGDCNDVHDRHINLMNGQYKIWITQNLDIKNEANVAQSLVSRIFKCDAKTANLRNQVLTSFKEFLFLIPEVVDLSFYGVIKENDSKFVSFDKILKHLPKLEEIRYFFKPNGSDITPDTVKNLSEMENLKKLKKMTLHHIRPAFDFDAFLKFMLENKHILFVLLFYRQSTTEEYMVNVKAFAKTLKVEDYGDHQRPEIRYNHANLVWG
uniref:FBD domain-containing protein n=1 Tax=Panagrolaimus sp. ES5 TaxID=591445 RepID=A0AC34GTQ1_9BILA